MLVAVVVKCSSLCNSLSVAWVSLPILLWLMQQMKPTCRYKMHCEITGSTILQGKQYKHFGGKSKEGACHTF